MLTWYATIHKPEMVWSLKKKRLLTCDILKVGRKIWGLTMPGNVNLYIGIDLVLVIGPDFARSLSLHNRQSIADSVEMALNRRSDGLSLDPADAVARKAFVDDCLREKMPASQVPLARNYFINRTSEEFQVYCLDAGSANVRTDKNTRQHLNFEIQPSLCLQIPLEMGTFVLINELAKFDNSLVQARIGILPRILGWLGKSFKTSSKL